jgi:hypothetical protein
MPFKSELIRNATISWPIPTDSAREHYTPGRESNVIRASSVFFGMYDPREMEKFGFNGDFLSYLTDYLGRIRGYDSKLIEDFKVVKYSPEDKTKRDVKRDFDATVTSHEVEGKTYLVKLGNLPYKVSAGATDREVFNEFLALLNLSSSCGCDAHERKGSNCSMPSDYYSQWFDVPPEEYDRILFDSTESKPYGHLVCKHQVKVLVDDGRFPHIFNKMRFYSEFPSMMKAIRGIGKKTPTVGDIDRALLPSIKRMSLGAITQYLHDRKILDKGTVETKNEVLKRIGVYGTF